MQHSPADVTRQLLQDAGFAPVFAHREPPYPDEALTVYSTATPGRVRTHVDGAIDPHNGVQIRGRFVDERRGWDVMTSVQEHIAEGVLRVTVTIDGEEYLVYCYSRIGDVLPIGKETPTSLRSLFTLNALVSIT